jgi:hypothetical protein
MGISQCYTAQVLYFSVSGIIYAKELTGLAPRSQTVDPYWALLACREKHSSLLGQFASYKRNEVL